MTEKPINPVLIVGAGPAGLALALSLVKNGVPVRIINKATTPHQEARGQGIQPRTLEIFHFLDVLSDVQAKGAPLKPVIFYKLPGGTEVLETTHLSVVEEDTPTKPFNNTYQVAQYHTEAVFRAHLEKYGCVVEPGTELVGLKQFEDHVEATLKKRVGEQEVTETQSFRWLIGADGGRSAVRKQSGFAFEGKGLERRAVLGEMDIDDLDTTRWHAWMRKDGGEPKTIMLGVVEDKRFFFMIIGHTDPDKLLASHEALKDAIREHTDRRDMQFGHIYYVSDYRPSVRMVDKFSDGRVFLVGDAAHVHAPRGGQGLNSSVQDSFNLGWKLALVERGLAPRALLATYTEERLPVIRRMLHETGAMGQRVKDTLGAGTDPAETARAMMQRTNLLKQLRINYRWSSLVRDERTPRAPDEAAEPYGVEAEDGLRAGDRAPNATGLVRVPGAQTTRLFDAFAPTCHTVLVFGGGQARVEPIVKALARCPQGTVTSVAVLPSGDNVAAPVDGVDVTLCDGDGVAYDAYRMTNGQAFTVIVRPDGVVGAIVAGEEGVAEYFNRIFSESVA